MLASNNRPRYDRALNILVTNEQKLELEHLAQKHHCTIAALVRQILRVGAPVFARAPWAEPVSEVENAASTAADLVDS